MHRSVATQINKGYYAYIDPAKYKAWSENEQNGSSDIWIARKP